MSTPTLAPETVRSILTTLAGDDSLRLPTTRSKKPPTLQDKEAYLNALLLHDPGVFLERHGSMITKEQLSAFEDLRKDSYEIDFYLKLLLDPMSPKVSTLAKNRRLAKMTRLAKEGYFEEETARKRAPLLHHQYLGQYKSEPPLPKAGTLHDQIFQQHEELQLRATMATQQRAEDAAGQAFDATLSESEEEDSVSDSGELPAAVKPAAWHEGAGAGASVSAEEMQQNQEDFRSLMEARFLGGEDGGADADNDASLDDDWAKQQNQDLEDQYFDS